MKMTLHNEQGAEVDLEITLPAQYSAGVYSFSFKFPDGKFRTVTFDKYDLRAMISWLITTL